MYTKNQDKVNFDIDMMVESKYPYTEVNEWSRNLQNSISEDLVAGGIPEDNRRTKLWERYSFECESVILWVLMELRKARGKLKSYEHADQG